MTPPKKIQGCVRSDDLSGHSTGPLRPIYQSLWCVNVALPCILSHADTLLHLVNKYEI